MPPQECYARKMRKEKGSLESITHRCSVFPIFPLLAFIIVPMQRFSVEIIVNQIRFGALVSRRCLHWQGHVNLLGPKDNLGLRMSSLYRCRYAGSGTEEAYNRICDESLAADDNVSDCWQRHLLTPTALRAGTMSHPHETVNIPNPAIGTDILLSQCTVLTRVGLDHYPPQSAPNQAPTAPYGVSNYADGSGHIFSMYLEMATEEDKKIVEDWKADADGILIFVRIL